MLGSDTFPRGSGSTDDIMVYVTFSGHLAAPESPMWWGRALFTTCLDMNVWVPRLDTVVRGTPCSRVPTVAPGPTSGEVMSLQVGPKPDWRAIFGHLLM
jgi:hypothetical protein